MVKFSFKADNGSIYPIEFDEQRIIRENNLTGFFDQTIIDNLNNSPEKKNKNKLYN